MSINLAANGLDIVDSVIKIGPSVAVQTVSDSRRPLFLVVGLSVAVQTVSDSRRPLFLVLIFFFFFFSCYLGT